MKSKQKPIGSFYYLIRAKKLILSSFKDNLGSVFVGIVATGLLSLFTWALAYFGFISLGLPQRFDFEILDHAIREELPSEYDYTIKKTSFRNVDTESLIVTARNRDFANIEKVDDKSDIILVFDKTERGYKKTYVFEPITENAKMALHVRQLLYEDMNLDGKKDIVIGLSYLGANYSPPYVVVLFSDSLNSTKVVAVQKLSNYEYPEDYELTKIFNKHDISQVVSVDSSYTFFARQGEILLVNRDDDACSACGDEHVYNLNTLSLYSDKLRETGSPVLGIKGYNALEDYAKEKGFSR